MAARYRLKTTKQGAVRFIGHLDMTRLFQRAANRAKLPMAYSQGFNPHQLISFAAPLGLGMTSLGEVADITLRETVDPDVIAARLSAALPEGVDIVKCRELEPEEKNAAASLSAAGYAITLPEGAAVSACVGELLSAKSIVLAVKSKKGLTQRDIRPNIYYAGLLEDGTLEVLLAAGSGEHLKPSVVAGYMCEMAGVPFEPLDIRYCRLEMYKKKNERFMPLC